MNRHRLAGLALLGCAGAAVGPAPVVGSAAGVTRVRVVDGRVTLDAHDAELVSVLSAMAKQAGVTLVVGRAPAVTVSTSFAGVPLDEALRRVLQGQSFVLVYGRDGAPAEIRVFESAPSGVSSRGPTAPAPAATDTATPPPTPAESRPQAVRQLVEDVAKDADPSVRARAAAALGHVGGDVPVAALANALGDDAPIVRIQAVESFARLQRAAALPVLSTMLKVDAHPRVREAVARALGSLGTDDARQALTTATEDADPGVREAAERALVRIQREQR